MIPRFTLARPTTLDEALAAHAATEGEGAYVAGGTELLQVMKMGLAQFATLIDLKRVPRAARDRGRGGRDAPDRRRRHPPRDRAEPARRGAPAGPRGARSGTSRTSGCATRGRIGGNLAFAEPHSDPATLLLACDARIELVGSGRPRSSAWTTSSWGRSYTSREPDDILVSIRVPAAGRRGRGYAKAKFFERPASRSRSSWRSSAGSSGQARVAVGSITEIPELVPSAARGLIGADATEASVATYAVGRVAAAFATVDAVDDLNGAADYKRHLAGVLLEQAALAAFREASAHA